VREFSGCVCLFIAIYIAKARDPGVCNIFAMSFCYEVGALNFPEEIRRSILILKAGKSREGFTKYCNISVVYFGNGIFNSFKNCQCFCGIYRTFF